MNFSDNCFCFSVVLETLPAIDGWGSTSLQAITLSTHRNLFIIKGQSSEAKGQSFLLASRLPMALPYSPMIHEAVVQRITQICTCSSMWHCLIQRTVLYSRLWLLMYRVEITVMMDDDNDDDDVVVARTRTLARASCTVRIWIQTLKFQRVWGSMSNTASTERTWAKSSSGAFYLSMAIRSQSSSYLRSLSKSASAWFTYISTWRPYPLPRSKYWRMICLCILGYHNYGFVVAITFKGKWVI